MEKENSSKLIVQGQYYTDIEIRQGHKNVLDQYP
jgi:hypothetical protein